jgi:hypothetical protein
MSTRRRGVPHNPAAGYAFTLLDEIRASKTDPLPLAQRQARVKDARDNLAMLTHGAEPSRFHWRVLATVGNIFEVMLELEMVNDPEGLLWKAQNTLKAAAEYSIEHGVAPRLVGEEAETIASLINAYEEVMAVISHREFIRVLRETDKRMRVLRPGDYNANPAKRRKP